MFDRAQFVASRFGEVGIQSQYLDGELYLVDNALSGAVTTRKQFEVFESVILAVAVNVMHGLLGKKIATKVFGHHVAVFHDRMAFAGHERWNAKPNVPIAFDMPAVLPGVEFGQSALPVVFCFAFAAAIYLFAVNPAACFPLAVVFLLALSAHKFVAFIGIFSPAYVRARHRTIQRIVAEFFAVRSKIALLHREISRAFFAREMHWHSTWCWKGFAEAMFASTFKPAILTSQLDFARIAVKRLFAILAYQLDRHLAAPLLGVIRGGEVNLAQEA